MYYSNYSENAVLELEKQRTGHYGDDFYENFSENCCDECGSSSKKLCSIGSQCLCEDCICELLREIYSETARNMPASKISASDILLDIISDFSDKELMSYVENRYSEYII